MVGKVVRGQVRKWSVCNLTYGFCESPLWPMDPGQPRTPAVWDAGFPGQLLSLSMVFVPLILEQIKQSSLINGFPPCLSEQIIKHSLHLSRLPSHPSCFPVRDICSVRLLLPALPHHLTRSKWASWWISKFTRKYGTPDAYWVCLVLVLICWERLYSQLPQNFPRCRNFSARTRKIPGKIGCEKKLLHVSHTHETVSASA